MFLLHILRGGFHPKDSSNFSVFEVKRLEWDRVGEHHQLEPVG